ncbi:MAG: hypothetical protein ACTSRP_18025 [Candidatus Helarchaeota archaeon]
MPYSLLIVDWDKIKGPNVKARYPPAEPHYNDDIPMQVFMMHTAKEPPEEQISLNLSGMDVLSQFVQYKQDGEMRRVIFMLLLKPDEKPIDFKRKLIKFKDEVIGKLDSDELPSIVENYFKEKLSRGIEEFSVEGFKKKLILQAQNLLEKGQTQLAREIIEKSERIPRTIFNILRKTDELLDKEAYEEAAKNYEDVVTLLTEIQEDDLAAEYAQKAMEIKKIPKLLSKQKDLLDKIHKITKKIDFNKLMNLLNEISKVSKELDQEDRAKGYSDQALALKQFIESNPDKEETIEEAEEEIELEVVDEDESE